MPNTVTKAFINRRYHTHGYLHSQVHAVLTYSDGTTKFLWMSDVDFADWIEDPLERGDSVEFDPETYVIHPF